MRSGYWCAWLLFGLTFGAAAETDLLPVIREAERAIDKAFAGEELTRKYYKDKVKKILDAPGDDDRKAEEIGRLLEKMRGAGTAEKSVRRKSNLRDSLVMVSGENGSGSGFITVLNGKKVIVTNIHVLMGTRQVKFMDCENRRLEYERIDFAADRDIAVIQLPDDDKAPALPLMEDVARCLAEEPVMVSGNSQGAGVATRLEGTLKGVGPTVVEVSAPFVQGNSGSPIISLKTGRVVGVATFVAKASESWVNHGSGLENIRRFGTRLDNLKPENLEKFSSHLYAQDIELYRKVKAANETGIRVLKDLAHNRGLLAEGNYLEDPAMQRLVRRWNDALTNPRFGSSYMNVLAEIIRHLETPANNCRKREIHYSFIRNEIGSQLKLEEAIVRQLNGLKSTLEESRRRMTRQAPRGL